MSTQIEISRDCDVMLIPSGTEVRLAKGTLVVITHKLGGNFTVSGSFGIARIAGKDADAIGEVLEEKPNTNAETNQQENQDESLVDKENFVPQESELWDAARTVYDPEIPLNIVDLGLVYKMDLIHSPDGKYAVEADMTLTAPGCAMGPVIADDLKMRLKAIAGIDDAIVNIVWDPPWHQDMISEEGKMTLGLL